jgi:hypothetical protein
VSRKGVATGQSAAAAPRKPAEMLGNRYGARYALTGQFLTLTLQERDRDLVREALIDKAFRLDLDALHHRDPRLGGAPFRSRQADRLRALAEQLLDKGRT